MNHVDVVKNEWLAGYQVVIARLHADGDQLHVDAPEPSARDLIDRYWRETHVRDAEQFVASLHELLVGDYVFASEPHDDSDCPYHGMVVAMRAGDPRAPVGA